MAPSSPPKTLQENPGQLACGPSLSAPGVDSPVRVGVRGAQAKEATQAAFRAQCKRRGEGGEGGGNIVRRFECFARKERERSTLRGPAVGGPGTRRRLSSPESPLSWVAGTPRHPFREASPLPPLPHPPTAGRSPGQRPRPLPSHFPSRALGSPTLPAYAEASTGDHLASPGFCRTRTLCYFFF